MTRKEAFEKIKKLFSDTDFTNVKCADGTILQWTGELKEGVALMIVGADANQTPAPDATYEVEDGSKITSVGGLVTKIDSKDGTDPAGDLSAVTEMMIAMGEKFNALTEKFVAIETKISAYDEKFTAIESVVNSTKTDTAEKFEAIKTLVNSIAEEPAADPIPQPNRFKKEKKDGEKTTIEKVAAWKKTLEK